MVYDDQPQSRSILGAVPANSGACQFRVWAPQADRLEVRIISPEEQVINLEKQERGYFMGTADDVRIGSLYFYAFKHGFQRPDPASRFQPNGVHGPSQVFNPSDSRWKAEGWRGLPLEQYIIYELHVGTYTPAGTFDAIIPLLPKIRSLGVTAIEVMPISQFPGSRNWGYDGVHPFAVQNTYGGPSEFQRWIDAVHQAGMAVVLDVVYNHLGPEGNYLADFGPYFSNRYRTPWGPAINFDGPGSDEVRHFFIENALYWLQDFRVDALRLDAIHGIFDFSAKPFLSELSEAVHALAQSSSRQIHLIAESDLNDVRVPRPPDFGGFGLDAQWNDDFHHSLHVLLTGEREGYYQDYGKVSHLAKAFKEGFVYSGQYSQFRGRRHGNSSSDVEASQLVVFAQNHDQVGNRMRGERLAGIASFEALKLAAGTVILSPFIPLLFMGEEYGEKAPFQYFTSHSSPELIEAVRKGRREEFARFQWPEGAPDPQSESTFLAAKLDHQARSREPHRTLEQFYRRLIELREGLPSLRRRSKRFCEVLEFEELLVLCMRRWTEAEQAQVIFNFNSRPVPLSLYLACGAWRKVLDSAEEQWYGPGSPAPSDIHSNGESRLTVPATSVVVLIHSHVWGSS
jgi:maltooligosyltrehalose trehalohydrolase